MNEAGDSMIFEQFGVERNMLGNPAAIRSRNKNFRELFGY